MVKTLVVALDRCTGCARCELACSYAKFKTMNPHRSAIQVIRRDRAPIDAPMFCNQCGICINACPAEAISRDFKTGAVLVDSNKCTGCGMCVHVCPFGVVTLDPVTKKAIKCDLCGGDPECVKHCPEKALLYIDSSKASYYKRLMFATLQKKERVPYIPYPR